MLHSGARQYGPVIVDNGLPRQFPVDVPPLPESGPPPSRRCYNTAMNWRRIERWATIAIYASAGIGLAILLAEALLPAGSPAWRIASFAANNLIRLGDIGGGLLFAIALTALSVMGGIWIMVLIAEGWSRLTEIIREERNWKTRVAEASREQGLEQGREQGLEQGREQGLEQGREQGMEEMRAIIQERLELLGINPADVLPPEKSEPYPDDNAAQTADAADADAELEDRIRHILQEQLARLGIRPDGPDDAPPQRGQ